MINLIIAAFFFIGFTFYKFDVLKLDLFRTFLGTVSKDYINIQWFIAWDLKHLLHGFNGYWSPPFYTPHANTLGFGDHILGQSALVLVPYLATHNTVFCYNVLFLLVFVLTGIATFAMCYQLTQHFWASLIMSAAFNFCNFRMGRLDHTYVLSIYPMIFFFTFAQKFVATRRTLFFWIAYLCLLWQILSGLNMGLYCFYIAFFFFAFYIWVDPTLRIKRFIVSVVAGHSVVAVAFVVMALPNLLALHAQEISFRWGDVVRHSANFGNFVTVPMTSHLFRSWMHLFYAQVATVESFPGLFILTTFGIAVWTWKSSCDDVVQPTWRAYLSYMLMGGGLMTAVMALVVFLNPALSKLDIEKRILVSDWSLLLILAALGVNKKWFIRVCRVFVQMPLAARFYAGLTIGSFLFSFAVFFHFLYWFFPGFNSVRVPVRLLEFFQLGLCVLGSYGLAVILRSDRIRAWRRAGVVLLLLAFFFETSHTSLATENAPVPPPSYTWLASQKNVTGVIDFPFPASVMDYQLSADYVYWNTFYWMPSVEGYSSFFPRYYYWLMESLKHGPVPPDDYLSALHVSHVVCHWNRMDAPTIHSMQVQLERQGLKELFVSPESSVYGVSPTGPDVTEAPLKIVKMRVTTSVHSDRAQFMTDGKRMTAWKTGRSQKIGDWVEVDFESPQMTKGLVMALGKNFMDYPRRIKLEAKKDGMWITLSENDLAYPTPSDFVSIVQTPNEPTITLRFPERLYSALRMTLQADAPENHWSIAEIGVL